MNINCASPLSYAAAIIASALFPSCANQTVRKDVRDSYGVLYPVKLAGSSIEAIGKSVSMVSSPKKWISPREKPFEQTTSPENEKLLAEKTVEYDITKPFEIQTGAGAGAGQFGGPLGARLLQTEAMVGYSFDWHLNPSLNDGAMAYPGGAIVINPNVLGHLSVPGSFFLFLHETGHHILGHTSSVGMMTAMSSPWVTRDRETEADIFAAQKMADNGVAPATIIYGALENFGSSPGDATHYPGHVRILKIKAYFGWP